MKKLILLLTITLMIGCKNSNKPSYYSFMQHVQETVKDKPAPETSFLGIKYNSSEEERYKYLFWESFKNEAIWTQVSQRFLNETKDMTPEETEATYQEYLEKNFIGDIYYIFQSEEDKEKESWGQVNLDPARGVLLRFDWNEEDTSFYDIVVPYYKKEYGEPGYQVTNEDGVFYYWLTDNCEIICITIDPEIRFAIITYEDATTKLDVEYVLS